MSAAPDRKPEPKIEIIRRLQKASAARDREAFLAFFAPDVVYHYHVGTRPLVGVQWVEKFITKYWANNSAAVWTIDHFAETEGALLTEGREDYVNASGQPVSHPYMGIIGFKDGLITAWRDYFQMNDPNAGK
ncbi:MAG: nuclear transport factor 2 family protein [Phenylobacterium sp.]